jgi:hypothetical protein
MKTTSIYYEDFHSDNDWKQVLDTLNLPHDTKEILMAVAFVPGDMADLDEYLLAQQDTLDELNSNLKEELDEY